MQLTEKTLMDAGCCIPGVDRYFKGRGITSWDAEALLDKAIAEGDFISARAAISRLMSKTQRVEWAIWCAEQVIGIFEKEHPDDSRPRNAINAAKAWLSDPTKENADNAHAAADAVVSGMPTYTVHVAYAAFAAVNAAAFAARDAARATGAAKAAGVGYESILRKGADILLREEK